MRQIFGKINRLRIKEKILILKIWIIWTWLYTHPYVYGIDRENLSGLLYTVTVAKNNLWTSLDYYKV